MSRQHFIALDGLRGVAALAVLLYHLRFWSFDGDLPAHAYLAVDFFFCLSGFVVTYAYELRLRSEMNFASFCLSRLIRLFPLIVLGAVCGMMVQCLGAVANHDLKSISNILLSAPFAALSLPALPQISKEPFLLNGPSWSLFFEILANLGFAVLLYKLRSRLLCALAAASGLALSVAIFANGSAAFGWTYPTLGLGLLRVAFPFLVGCLICRLHQAQKLAWFSLSPAVTSAALVGILFTPKLPLGAGAYFDLLCLIAIFPAIIIASRKKVKSVWGAKLLSELGRVSFPLYILHAPMIAAFVMIATRIHLPEWLYIPLSVTLILPTCYLVGTTFDEPLRSYLNRMQARSDYSKRT